MVFLLRSGATFGLFMAFSGIVVSLSAETQLAQLGGVVALCIGLLTAVCGFGFAGVIRAIAFSTQTTANMQMNHTPRHTPPKRSRPETFGSPADLRSDN